MLVDGQFILLLFFYRMPSLGHRRSDLSKDQIAVSALRPRKKPRRHHEPDCYVLSTLREHQL